MDMFNHLYNLNEVKNAFLKPAHFWSQAQSVFLNAMPIDDVPMGRFFSASTELLQRSTRSYERPAFGISEVIHPNFGTVKVVEDAPLVKPFCSLKHFMKVHNHKIISNEAPVLIVAPMSGHYATLLRDTVRAMIPTHDVYVTDWHDARDVSFRDGNFDLNDYVDYLLEFIRFIGKGVHLLAVCQPSVPVMMASSILAEDNSPYQPSSMILMGGPIDTRIHPGQVNLFAQEHPIEWYEENLIAEVPLYYPGAGRRVCPGFLMLQGFMSMNTVRHQEATFNFFQHLVSGDEESAQAHRRFYDEYLAVMDLPADYFLQSVNHVFQLHSLSLGKMRWRYRNIIPRFIEKTALLIIEGEMDDISPPGQTYAAHDLCTKLPEHKKEYYLQKGVGHYGLFNGHRWRETIQPKVAAFIEKHRV